MKKYWVIIVLFVTIIDLITIFVVIVVIMIVLFSSSSSSLSWSASLSLVPASSAPASSSSLSLSLTPGHKSIASEWLPSSATFSTTGSFVFVVRIATSYSARSIRGYLHETGTNSDRYELLPVWNFCNRLHETGTKCLVPGFGTKWHILSNKYIVDRKSYRLEISGPGLRFVIIYTRTVRTQIGTRISRLGLANETKSDRSEFIVRPVSCKRMKRNVWRSIRTHAGLSLSRSRVTTPLDCRLQVTALTFQLVGFRKLKYSLLVS